MHRTLDAALARNSGPSAEDVEAAAHALCAAIPVNTTTTWDHVHEHYREWCRDQARAFLASDWLAAHTAAADARGAERGARAVVKAVEAYYQNDAGSHAGYGRAARGAAAVTTASAKSSDLATRVPQDESQHRVEGGA
jgi:DNA-binding SARP family transcriptional activator